MDSTEIREEMDALYARLNAPTTRETWQNIIYQLLELDAELEQAERNEFE